MLAHDLVGHPAAPLQTEARAPRGDRGRDRRSCSEQIEAADAEITAAAERLGARSSATSAAMRKEEELLAQRLAALDETRGRGARSARGARARCQPSRCPTLPPTAAAADPARVAVETLRRDRATHDARLARAPRRARRARRARSRRSCARSSRPPRRRAPTPRRPSPAAEGRPPRRPRRATRPPRPSATAAETRGRGQQGVARRVHRARPAARDLRGRGPHARRHRAPDPRGRAAAPRGAPGRPRRARGRAHRRRHGRVAREASRARPAPPRACSAGSTCSRPASSRRCRSGTTSCSASSTTCARPGATCSRSIAQVDQEITETFTTAYRDVAMQFERLIAELFPGGEGRLVLTDPAEPLTSGIEIEASPGPQAREADLAAVGRRALAHRDGVPVRDLHRAPLAVLPDGRGRARARRREPAPVPPARRGVRAASRRS